MIDPFDALDCLLGKWIIKACEPGDSNLLTFLRYRLSLFKPVKDGRWAPNASWFLSPSHKSAPGSKIWNRAGKAWRKLCKHVQWINPRTFEEVSSTNLWHNPDFGNNVQAAFTRERAGELYKLGLRKIKDVWSSEQGRGCTWLEAQTRFNFLRAGDAAGWDTIARHSSYTYEAILTAGPRPPPNRWTGSVFSLRNKINSRCWS